MTTFIVNGQEKTLRYDVNGIDISGDFIGNTSHGMGIDDESRYVASPEDFEWWQNTISAHGGMEAAIAKYKEQFDPDQVDQVVQDWATGDYETDPTQVLMGLRKNFKR